MTTETVIMLDITTITEQLDMMLANQQVSMETAGFQAGLIVGLVVLATVIMWVSLVRG